MSKTLKVILTLLVAVFLFKPMNTLAVTFSSNSAVLRPKKIFYPEKIKAIKERIQLRREEVKSKIKERRASISARLTERRRNRIKRFFSRLIKRLNIVTNRLNRLVARIESRLEKIKANNENIDAEKIEKQLTEIKSKLSVVSTNIQDAQNSLNTILESNEPKQAFKDVRDLVKEIKNEFIDIHRLLVHLIGDIKGLRVGESNGSTNN